MLACKVESGQWRSDNHRAGVGAPDGTTKVIEYHHAAFDHYIITPVAAEIALLDAHAPPFEDWSRTGFSFNVYPPAGAPAGSVAICRFFNGAQEFALLCAAWLGMRSDAGTVPGLGSGRRQTLQCHGARRRHWSLLGGDHSSLAPTADRGVASDHQTACHRGARVHGSARLPRWTTIAEVFHQPSAGD